MRTKTKYLRIFLLGLMALAAPRPLPVRALSAPATVPFVYSSKPIFGQRNLRKKEAVLPHPRPERPERAKTRHWIWFGVLLALAAGFIYLTFAFFALAATAEVAVGFFQTARWWCLLLGGVALGWSVRHFIRAWRRKKR